LGEPLGLSFQHQVVFARFIPRVMAPPNDFPASQVILARMIDIDTSNAKRLRRRKMVDTRLHTERKAAPFEIEVVGDELMRLGIFANNIRLPGQILGNLLTLIA
jgi:hypothetical protein